MNHDDRMYLLKEKIVGEKLKQNEAASIIEEMDYIHKIKNISINEMPTLAKTTFEDEALNENVKVIKLTKNG